MGLLKVRLLVGNPCIQTQAVMTRHCDEEEEHICKKNSGDVPRRGPGAKPHTVQVRQTILLRRKINPYPLRRKKRIDGKVKFGDVMWSVIFPL
jgi:hypothetical protein